MKSILRSASVLVMLSTAPAEADVIFELLGPSEIEVEQAFPYSPQQVFPIQGESLLVWGRITNTGSDLFQATGPGGTVSSSTGNVTSWCDSPRHLWNPNSDPNDPFVLTPLGHHGIELQPGHSAVLPILEIWGLADFAPAPIGSYATYLDPRMSFWEGFDRDPNDQFDSPDLFATLDTDFTVTVVPEPSTMILVAFCCVSVVARAGRSASRQCPTV